MAGFLIGGWDLEKISKGRALNALAADRATGRRHTQRQYAESWGVSLGTANAWILSAPAVEQAEHELNTPPEQSAERPEQTEHLARISAKLNTISDQLNTLLELKIALSHELHAPRGDPDTD